MKKEEYTDLAALKKQTSVLKDEIRKLGDVNVNAIEDYKNIAERYEFMNTQRNDLVKAEETRWALFRNWIQACAASSKNSLPGFG